MKLQLAGDELEVVEQVLHVDQADDVVDVLVAQREARVRALLHDLAAPRRSAGRA